MKLFKISQTFNTGYDTFDSAIVCAPCDEYARNIAPGSSRDTWCAPERVTVEYIGEATEGVAAGVVLASFNAG